MKKNFFLIGCLCFTFQLLSQHIGDANFAQAIRFDCPTCINSANDLTEDARKWNSLTIAIHDVSDLAGIEGFTSLTFLHCSNNNLTALPDNLPSRLVYINIAYNKITSLKNIPNGCKEFDCSNNKITVLPELPASLLALDCSFNKLTTLPQLKNLTSLYCTDNQLTALPTLPNGLEGLICSYNKITTVPDLPKPMIRLSCQYNLGIKCLPLLPEGLKYLDITKNIVCLPNVVKNLAVDVYEGLVPTSVNMPICSSLRPLPCDTFPQRVGRDTTIKKSDAKITIFPNPTDDEVTIKCQNCTVKKITVFNAFGQIIMEVQANVLDFSTLASAMYIVRIEAENGYSILERVMKM